MKSKSVYSNLIRNRKRKRLKQTICSNKIRIRIGEQGANYLMTLEEFSPGNDSNWTTP